MGETSNKLSLVSQFDDLCRYEGVLHEGLEMEFLKFVRNQEACRVRWQQLERDFRTLQEEYEITVLEREHWKKSCEDLRNKAEIEQKRRADAERRLRELTNLFGEVKEVVNRDNTITDQTKERFAMWQTYKPMEPITENELPEPSMEFDNTEEMLAFNETKDLPGSKRQSRSRRDSHTPPKRNRPSSENVRNTSKSGSSIVATTTVNIPSHGGNIVASTKLDAFRQSSVPPMHVMITPSQTPVLSCIQSGPENLRRHSHIEPQVIHLEEPPINQGKFTLVDNVNSENIYPTAMLASMTQPEVPNLMRIGSKTSLNQHQPINNCNSLPFRQHNSGSKLNSKVHDFVTKTIIRPETCLPCGRRIRFYKQALKCCNCRATCHPECKNSVPMPCVPITHTPKKAEVTLAALAPEEPPRVPAPIVYCVNEIEQRGKEVGLYRLSGPDREVKELKEKVFKGKLMPNLSGVDVHVICAFIKDLLRSLDPLVPKLMWKDFTDAADKSNQEERLSALYQCIGQLPLANRDTMAFLMLHWQRVADCPEVKMPIKNLATVLGPTVVGFSSSNLNASTIMKEQVLQVKAMENLLLIPSSYWDSFITEQEVPLFRSVVKPSDLITPESRTSRTLKRANTAEFQTPRLGSLPRRPVTRGQQRFFASPGLQP